ncbi:MAG: hypothetical protein V3U26_05170 [Dehalococcoidia bacterium]
MDSGIQVLGKVPPKFMDILTPEALAFVADLAREFEPTRSLLMQARAVRQQEIDSGRVPDFPPETRGIRREDWKVAPAPKDLQDRRVEITGPASDRKVPEVEVTAKDLLEVPRGEVTEAGLRNNVAVALQYLAAWLQGRGAVAINWLMEDTATAEIARAQVWQWMRRGAHLRDGRPVTEGLYREVRAQELAKLVEARGPDGDGHLDKAAQLLDELITAPTFTEFLTIPGYSYLQ